MSAALPQGLHARFRATALLGEGGGGRVWRCEDVERMRDVAIKLPFVTSAELWTRHSRECAALRSLRLPGVVEILEEGLAAGQPYIVMEMVAGAPFPGALPVEPEARRERILDVTESLLETLARVHASGIVHRDLKPANVLVAAHPTLLDFGLARGAALASTVTESGAMVGTPRYLAPEQIRGLPVDARTDLYACGLLIFEALAGQPAHDAGDWTHMLTERLLGGAPDLAAAAPDAPDTLCTFVASLLQPEPSGRPESATAALALLRAARRNLLTTLPWLGSRALVDAVVAAARAGVPFRIGGAAGSGRTRTAREAADVLEREGHRLVWLPKGERPFASLRALGGDPRDADAAAGLLAATLATGVVIVADTDVDAWTRGLLEAPAVGAAILVGSARGDGAPAPLSARDLQPLFAGPERVLHLVTDASEALRACTRGEPDRIVREVAAWTTTGLARWQGERLIVDRGDVPALRRGARRALENAEPLPVPLDRLLAAVELAWPVADAATVAAIVEGEPWELRLELAALEERGCVASRADGTWVPLRRARWLAPDEWRREAHRRVAAALPEPSPDRLRHLLAAGARDEAAAEATRAAEVAHRAGRIDDALAALHTFRVAAGPCPSLARLHVHLAFAAEDARALADAGRALAELGGAAPEVLRTLVEGGLCLHAGAELPPLFAADAPPLPDEDLEGLRLLVTFGAALGAGRAEAVLSSAEVWAGAHAPALEARLLGWRGLLRYRAGDYARAATLHLAAAARKPDAGGRLASLVNAALALVEDHQLDGAEIVAAQVRAAAAELRLPRFEAHAERALRSIAYRRELRLDPDLELVRATEVLGFAPLHAAVLLGEAAFAWRAGDLQLGLSLARRSRESWRPPARPEAALLADGLALVCEPAPDAAAVERLAAAARDVSQAGLAMQALALACRAHPRPPRAWHAEITRRAAAVSVPHRGRRLEILSVSECLHVGV